jgi:outer membrane protein assembly factor BamB
VKRIGTGTTSLFRHQARLVILLSLVAAVALAGCAGRQGVGSSESWSGLATQPGANTAFVGTRDGRVIELLLDVGRNDRIIPRVGAVFDANERAESGNRVEAAFYGTPTIAGDRVYVGSYQGFVYSLAGLGSDQRTLADVGAFEIDGDNLAKGIAGDVIYADGALVIAAAEDTDKGRLYVLRADQLDLNTGPSRTERCRYPAGEQSGVGRMWTTPLVLDGTVYFGDLERQLHAVDLETCQPVWDQPAVLGGGIVATPVALNGKLYVGAFDRSFYQIDIATGLAVKQFEADRWFWASPATDGKLIYAPNLDGKLYAYDPQYRGNGGVIWTYDQEGDLEQLLSPPAIVEGKIVLASDSGIVTLLDPDGTRLRSLGNANDKVRAKLTVQGNTVYVRSLDEIVTAYKVSGDNFDKDWEFKIEGF